MPALFSSLFFESLEGFFPPVGFLFAPSHQVEARHFLPEPLMSLLQSPVWPKTGLQFLSGRGTATLVLFKRKVN